MKRREHPGTAPAVVSTPSPSRIESGVRGRVALTNLAHPPTRFVGRRREMSELRTLLVEHPLVTVLGPPGGGKTRLAAELARIGGAFDFLDDDQENIYVESDGEAD